MRKPKTISMLAWFTLLALISSSVSGRGQAPVRDQNTVRHETPWRTQCDPSLPISVELVPENEPRVGLTARFRFEVRSDLDPDLIRDMRVEYETPPRLQIRSDLSREPERLAKSGRSQLRFGVVVPDEARYSIRARVIVTLTNGKTISQTAVHWIDLGAEDPPEGMVGRIVDPDGTGIRVYQGTTARKQQ